MLDRCAGVRASQQMGTGVGGEPSQDRSAIFASKACSIATTLTSVSRCRGNTSVFLFPLSAMSVGLKISITTSGTPFFKKHSFPASF